MFALLLVKS